jgi:PAS domain S-box-containing protein
VAVVDVMSMDTERTIFLPNGGKHEAWLLAQQPYMVRETIKQMFGVIRHLPHSQAIAVVSAAGKVVACNDALLKLLDLQQADDLLNRQWSLFMPGYTDRTRAFTHDDIEPFEEHLVGREGQHLWAHVSVSLIMEDRENRPAACALFITPLREHGGDEETQRRQRENYQLLAETQRALVLKVDTDGRLLFVSPSFCKRVGEPEQKLLGTNWIEMLHPDDRPRVDQAMTELRRPPFIASGTWRVQLKDGWTEIDWTLDAVIEDGGRVVAFAIVGRAAAPAVAPAGPRDELPLAAEVDPRVGKIVSCMDVFTDDREQNLRSLATVVGEIIGAQTVTFRVPRGDGYVITVGWKLD